MIKISQDLIGIIEARGTVVVPTTQRAEAARLAYAAFALESGLQVWRTPDILPLEAWVAREIYRQSATDARLPRLLSPAEDWLIWRDATLALTTDLELIARAPLAEALKRADALALDHGIDVSAVHGTEQMLLRAVRAKVLERHRELDATTASRLAATLPALGDERPVLFVGFSATTARLQALIEARRSRGWETHFAPTAESGAPARVICAQDVQDELECIAGWARSRLASRPDARLLVMLPGARAVRERLAILIRQSLDPSGGQSSVAIEGGDPLIRFPVVAQALASLRWLTQGAELADCSDWLRSPYWRAPDLSARCRIESVLCERLPLEPRIHDILGALSAMPIALEAPAALLADALRGALDSVQDGRATLHEWSQRFHAALDRLGWQGVRAQDSDEHQVCERFLDLLRELGGLDTASGAVTRQVALQWLQELAASTSFRPASGDALVTISPSVADPIVRYDGIWVAGLTADAWPQPVAPDAFLPLVAQRAAGVPAASAAGRLAEARTAMAAWSAATHELVLSAASHAEDMELLPSPLLSAGSSLKSQGPAVWLPRVLHRDHLIETVRDTRGLPWNAEQPLPSGTRSLELQNECPFRAYAQLRLGCAPRFQTEPGVAADERGRLLHSALERFWGTVRDSATLENLSAEMFAETLQASITAAASALWKSSGEAGYTPAQEREIRRTRRLVTALCELEKARTPFAVTHTELDTPLVIGDARLRVRIDRIDTLADGGLAILDYKSGRPVTADWYGERPSHTQLLVYLAAIGEQTRAMATVNVTAREVRFDGIAVTSDVLPRVRAVQGPAPGARDAWPLRYGEWRTRLENLARAFLAGDAAVDPRPHACDYCHLASLCRIVELGASEEGSQDE